MSETSNSSFLAKLKELSPAFQLLGIGVALVSLLFGPAIISQIRTAQTNRKPPEFSFQFEGLPDSEETVFEVTQEFDGLENVEPININIAADYSGSDYRGPVTVQLIPASGPAIDIARWDQFHLDSDISLSYSLDPTLLYQYANVQDKYLNLDTYDNTVREERKSGFEIVVKSGTEMLTRKPVTVVNTPWYHTVQLSDSSIRVNEPVTATVRVHNQGFSSDFIVTGAVHLVPESIGADSLYVGPEGWWPTKSWLIQGDYFQEEIAISQNEQGTVQLVFPGDLFSKEGSIYIIETYAKKDLPYVRFSSVGALSDDGWRLRDKPLYSTVVVLAP